MNTLQDIPGTLDQFEEIANATQSLLEEENRSMRENPQPPSEKMLQRKKELLMELDAAITHTKQSQLTIRSQPFAARLEKLQARYMRLLMLDRENERLLLKNTMPVRPKPFDAPIRNLSNTYGQAGHR